jgi:hypothetical protein
MNNSKPKLRNINRRFVLDCLYLVDFSCTFIKLKSQTPLIMGVKRKAFENRFVPPITWNTKNFSRQSEGSYCFACFQVQLNQIFRELENMCCSEANQKLGLKSFSFSDHKISSPSFHATKSKERETHASVCINRNFVREQKSK